MSWPLSPASSQSLGGQLSCFSCCSLVTRAENSSCSVSVTLDTPGDIWKSASVCLRSGFQFSGPGSVGMQTGLPWPWRVGSLCSQHRSQITCQNQERKENNGPPGARGLRKWSLYKVQEGTRESATLSTFLLLPAGCLTN